MQVHFRDFTAAPGTRGCICAVCNLTGVMEKTLPQMPRSLDEMPAAVTVTLMSPEGIAAWRPVLGMFDGLNERSRKLTVAMLDQLDPANRSVTEFMLDGELRDALASMLSEADDGRVVAT